MNPTFEIGNQGGEYVTNISNTVVEKRMIESATEEDAGKKKEKTVVSVATQPREIYDKDLAEEFGTMFGMYQSLEKYEGRLEQYELTDEDGRGHEFPVKMHKWIEAYTEYAQRRGGSKKYGKQYFQPKTDDGKKLDANGYWGERDGGCIPSDVEIGDIV